MDGNGDLYSFVSMGFDWYDARADGRCRGPGTGAVACDARQAGNGALAAHRARNAERAAQLVPGRRAADDTDSRSEERRLGKESVSRFRYRWEPYKEKYKIKLHTKHYTK